MSYSPIMVDDVTGVAINIPYEHHEIHEGNSYVASYFASAVGSGSDVDIKVIAPNTATRIHMFAFMSGSVEFEALVYEGGNVTAGTALTAVNRDRNSANAATVVCTYTPVVTTTGTLIFSGRFGSGIKGGGESRGQEEFILDQGTTYLYRVTSRATGNAVTIQLNWYEE